MPINYLIRLLEVTKMDFLLTDPAQYNKAVLAITGQELLKESDISGFRDFVVEIKKAIDAKLKVEMRFEAADNVVTKQGIVDFCSLEIDDAFSETRLAIHLADAQPEEHYMFKIAPKNYEWNTLSKPNDFMKFYLKNEDHSVNVTVIVKY